MEIIKSNIKDDELNMDLLYALFEDEGRLPLKDVAGKTIEVKNYARYTDINVNDEEVDLLAIDTGSGVYVTSSRSFIRGFDRIVALCELAGNTLETVTVKEDEGKNRRKYLVCAYPGK